MLREDEENQDGVTNRRNLDSSALFYSADKRLPVTYFPINRIEPHCESTNAHREERWRNIEVRHAK